VLERAFSEAGEEYDIISYIANGEHCGRVLHIPADGSPQVVKDPNSYKLQVDQRKESPRRPRARYMQRGCPSFRHRADQAPLRQPLDKVIERCAEQVGGEIFLILDQFENYFQYNPFESGDAPFASEFARLVTKARLPAGVILFIREESLGKAGPV